MNMPTTLLIILISYLLGCFTTGYYLVRLFTGQDIRALASGNVGSRNVGRLLGAKGFILTFIGDAGKGLLAVYLVQRLGGGQLPATAALIAVTAGHIWPLQMRFRGGKGFATYAGGMLLLYPHLLLLGLALCALLYPLLRRTTVTGLAALACTPLLLAFLLLRRGVPLPVPEFALYCLLVLLVLCAHRANIRHEFEKSAGEE
ncbi:MAG: glycerol-3-phosphate acyltransferase [Desulfuromonadaceae bacterium]